VAEVEAAIDRLGCVQLDAISAVDRSQRLVLAARVGRLQGEAINTLLRRGRVFEYWAHEACLIPSDDHRFFRAAMRDSTHHEWAQRPISEHPEIADAVMSTIRERGPVSAGDFGGAGTGYWGWSPAKRILESLWTTGQIAVAYRRGAERRYDLPERVLPGDALGAPEPTAAERIEHFVERSVRARGLLREARAYDYYRLKGGVAAVRPAIDALCERGVLERVQVADAGVGVVAAEDVARYVEDEHDGPRGAFLVSPFDNVLWDRVEARVLFAFDHALEIYKRPHERVWGYYVLPLLDGHQIVGRVDAKADRKAGVMRALAVHWQGRPRPRALRESLERLAWLLGLPDTEVPGGVRDEGAARRAGA
jgi:uncharacterized protein YcaQ